ncbi:hypothetical protein N658DRAFT_189404 [Parathielavia hyrcaniae]|uniref:Uncharacterized protein n=1 Tax=Parathielavia hyrcaniae TaxID=113614 RepID=A0AAN6QCN8_9PEZI|nr:hypothetical protein N658DRAFT_189404 [Parathielavia hyrcaniae]
MRQGGDEDEEDKVSGGDDEIGVAISTDRAVVLGGGGGGGGGGSSLPGIKCRGGGRSRRTTTRTGYEGGGTNNNRFVDDNQAADDDYYSFDDEDDEARAEMANEAARIMCASCRIGSTIAELEKMAADQKSTRSKHRTRTVGDGRVGRTKQDLEMERKLSLQESRDIADPYPHTDQKEGNVRTDLQVHPAETGGGHDGQGNRERKGSGGGGGKGGEEQEGGNEKKGCRYRNIARRSFRSVRITIRRAGNGTKALPAEIESREPAETEGSESSPRSTGEFYGKPIYGNKSSLDNPAGKGAAGGGTQGAAAPQSDKRSEIAPWEEAGAQPGTSESGHMSDAIPGDKGKGKAGDVQYGYKTQTPAAKAGPSQSQQRPAARAGPSETRQRPDASASSPQRGRSGSASRFHLRHPSSQTRLRRDPSEGTNQPRRFDRATTHSQVVVSQRAQAQTGYDPGAPAQTQAEGQGETGNAAGEEANVHGLDVRNERLTKRARLKKIVRRMLGRRRKDQPS